jgi:hypothetical protein
MPVVGFKRDQFLQGAGNIVDNAGIGVFINHNAAGGMGYEDAAKALIYSPFFADIIDHGGDLHHLNPLGGSYRKLDYSHMNAAPFHGDLLLYNNKSQLLV